MQFKHPELLWALLLLLIPIFIHLFQLRRFKKTPFTNVAMLQKVVAESRKSNTLKKWLLLTTRLLLFASLIVAFAQPFFAKESALKEKETVIYLDDSFSMQAKTEGSTLLEKAIQDLIKAIPSTGKISLFTNQKTFKDVELRAIQNNLLQLQTGSKQLKYNDIVLKGSTLFSNKTGIQKNLILVSDFQDQLFENQIDSIKNIQLYLAKMNPDTFSNIALDTVYFGAQKNDQLELIAEVSGVQDDQTLPISLYNGNTLIAKTAVEPSNKGKSKVVFSLQKDQPIQGRIQIDDNGLSYDNQFFFNIEKKEKIKVLAVNEESDNYLKRLFQNEEFDFLSFSPNDLKYSQLTTQNLIILNGLKAIPTSLQNILIEYYKEGGHLVIIPALKPDLNSYNSFLSPLRGITISNGQQSTQAISKISFNHPLYKNVFEKQVTNFDYPEIEKSFRANFSGTKALSYSNDEPFLIASDNLYLFTGSLDVTNSSFINSPLVVPTFYNMAQNSLKRYELYLTLKTNASVDVSTALDKDNIIKMASARENFVPLQQNFNNRVRLTFLENPASDGIYAALNGTDTLQHIAFNYLRDESVLNYEKASLLPSINQQKGIEKLFEQLDQDNSITDYWKWFVIFALLFALMEVLIQKFLS